MIFSYYYIKYDRVVMHMTFKEDDDCEATVDRVVVEEEKEKKK